MGARGTKPKGKVKIAWSSNFAYAIGLIVSDGCLYKNNRHIAFVSKDMEQIHNYLYCFDIDNRISKVQSGHNGVFAYRVQFSDTQLHLFLRSIGVHPAKSKTIQKLTIPKEFFFDFLRGSFDGDGSFYSYWDKRWRSSHMFYVEFISASKVHVDWLRDVLRRELSVWGHITNAKKSSVFQLKYAKKEALEIIKKMYYSPTVVCLSRKRLKIEKALEIEDKQQMSYKQDKARVAELV